jgi:serine protease AprX
MQPVHSRIPGGRRFVGALITSVLTGALVAAMLPGVSAAAATPRGLSQILTTTGSTATIRGIATFSSVPSSSQVTALRGLGLEVQPMQKVRLALVKGRVSAMQQAVSRGIALDVYPDEKLQYLDTKSSNAMGAASLRAAGWTGKGVTVGVVDSGCDASHPDLADHVQHNVIIYSGEYANQHPNADNTIAVPVEEGPYQNSDLGSGHGTHVAGIVAADSTSVTDKSRYGVAPDAGLVCFAIGSVLFTTAVVTAYDYLLRQPDLWGVDVINNSWGNMFRQFDPNDPVSVITKAVYDQGQLHLDRTRP